MKFESEDPQDVDLLDLTDTDVRHVSVVWRNDDDGNGRPELILGGMSEFEACGVLRAALRRLEAYTKTSIDLPPEIEAELDGDDDEEDA
jgi:hypothetical protein